MPTTGRVRQECRPAAESATGLGGLGEVRLLDTPHTADNYLFTEMGYRIARKHAAKLRRVAIRGGFAEAKHTVTLYYGSSSA